MRKISVRKNPKQLPLLAFLFILLSIPLAVYGLLNIESFDPRNRAGNNTIEPNSCVISFPFVNPSSIEVDKLVQVEVSAYIPEENITQVSIMDRSGSVVFKKDYTNTPNDKISESFTFTSSTTGEYSMLGTVVTNKSTKPCVIEENRQISVITSNLAPEFKSLPTEAKPGNAIKVKDSYEYLLKVEDAEKDTINYAFSFTPGANWLKYTVIEDGGNGKLTIKFTGIPDKPASYLANIFIHDGYNQHLRAQSWVISVDQDKNDVPKVSVYAPSKDTTVTKGAVVKISWEASDLNLISKYEVFLTTNPGNQNSWIPLERNLSNKVGSYLLNTSSLEPGTYQVVVRATDNFKPPAQGVGVSPRISVDSPTPDNDVKKPDDGIILVDPQIINISPSNNSSLKNKKATISATLVAGTDAKIAKDTIKVNVNDKDVTKEIRINEISESEFSLIYTTKEDFKIGKQKVTVSFKDTKGNEAEKDWTFTVTEEKTDSEDVYDIFGFEIPKRTAWIIGGGILLLLLAILIPWILYLLWRGSKEDDYETIYNNTYPVSPSPAYNATEPMDYEDEKKKEKVKEVKDEKKIEIKKEEPKEIVKEKTEVHTTTTEKVIEKEDSKPKLNLWTPILKTKSQKKEEKVEEMEEIKEDITKEVVETPAPEEIKVIETEKTTPTMWTPTYTPEPSTVKEVTQKPSMQDEQPVSQKEESKADVVAETPKSETTPYDSTPVIETPTPASEPPVAPSPLPEEASANTEDDQAETDVTADELNMLAEQLKALESNDQSDIETTSKDTTKVEEIQEEVPTAPVVETKAEEPKTVEQPAPPVVQFNSPAPQEDKKDNFANNQP